METKQTLPEQTVKIELTLSEVQFILDVLAEKPWKDVNSIIVKIANQVQKQIKEATT